MRQLLIVNKHDNIFSELGYFPQLAAVISLLLLMDSACIWVALFEKLIVLFLILLLVSLNDKRKRNDLTTNTRETPLKTSLREIIYSLSPCSDRATTGSSLTRQVVSQDCCCIKTARLLKCIQSFAVDRYKIPSSPYHLLQVGQVINII